MSKLITIISIAFVLCIAFGCGKSTSPNEEEIDTIEVDDADLFCDADTCAADTVIADY